MKLCMRDDHMSEAGYIVIDEVRDLERRSSRRQTRFYSEDEIVNPWSYAAKRGKGRIRLSLVEYRILQFLAARPNRAMTRCSIANAVSTPNLRVTAETLADYVRSLRGQLGFYSDYIQSVPYIGYRFKG